MTVQANQGREHVRKPRGKGHQDTNEPAFLTVQQATGQIEKPIKETEKSSGSIAGLSWWVEWLPSPALRGLAPEQRAISQRVDELRRLLLNSRSRIRISARSELRQHFRIDVHLLRPR